MAYIKIEKARLRGNRKIFDAWAQSNNVVSVSEVVTLHYLSNQTCRKRAWLDDDPPYLDHANFFLTSDGRRLYVYQPYVRVDYGEDFEAMCDKILKWALGKGLKVTFEKPENSWHYTGKTMVVIIEVDNEEEYIKYYANNCKK